MLSETIDTLAWHSLARDAYTVILAMEEGEPAAAKKAEQLIALFGHRFASMIYTVHPKNIEGEARGKSSNVAWAAKEYARVHASPDREQARYEVISVMDADTQLTEKYFYCLTYRYCMASEDQQKMMLFAPTLVFDRNANDVPVFVRLTDMCWSIGLISNFQLPVKFPCSMYTLTRQLAERVNYWDAGPEAIGEDMHMALKCWTRTQMALNLVPIYVPASCSNVQGNTYWESLTARFDQAKRHLWGTLDFGYAFASLISQRCYWHRLFKSVMCVYLLFEISFQPFFGFYHLSGQLLYPQYMTAFGSWVLEYTTYIRMALIPPAIVVVFAYERYHYLACHYRAAILRSIEAKRAQQSAADVAEEAAAGVSAPLMISHDQEAITHHPLVAFRQWYSPADWGVLPIDLFFFYMLPAFNAMLRQLISNRYDYKVSLKPQAKQQPTAAKALEDEQQVDDGASDVTKDGGESTRAASMLEQHPDTPGLLHRHPPPRRQSAHPVQVELSQVVAS